MAKKEFNKEVLELKKWLAEKKAVLGFKEVLEELKNGLLAKIFLASNCPEKIKSEIEYYSGLGKVPVKILGIDNEEIGVFCKKHFFISVLGVRK